MARGLPVEVFESWNPWHCHVSVHLSCGCEPRCARSPSPGFPVVSDSGEASESDAGAGGGGSDIWVSSQTPNLLSVKSPLAPEPQVSTPNKEAVSTLLSPSGVSECSLSSPSQAWDGDSPYG